MESYKQSCVIDANGIYQEFVLVLLPADGNQQIVGYALKSGEMLLDVNKPVGIVKAHWTGAAWEEGATAEEITAWEAEHPAPEVPPPSQLDSVEAQSTYTAMMTNTLLEG